MQAFSFGACLGPWVSKYSSTSCFLDPNVLLVRALWSLFDGIWGFLKGSGGGTYFGLFGEPWFQPDMKRRVSSWPACRGANKARSPAHGSFSLGLQAQSRYYSHTCSLAICEHMQVNYRLHYSTSTLKAWRFSVLSSTGGALLRNRQPA